MSESLTAHEKHGPTGEESRATPLWLTALADLLVRIYDQTARSGRVIRPYSHPDPAMHAFTQRDFDAMSLTSLALLRAGEVDVAAEVHELMTACMQPASQWCGEAVGSVLNDLVLIDPDLLVPTEDCQTLAGEFGSSLSDTLERAIYKQFREELGLDSTSDSDMSSRGFSPADCAQIYTRVRETVIRSPLTRLKPLQEMLADLGARNLDAFLTRTIYQPLGEGHLKSGDLVLCGHCGSLLPQPVDPARGCAISECRQKNEFMAGETVEPGDDLYMVNPVLQKYWVGPGLDEIELYDAAISAGLDADLFPNMDACDVALPGRIGIDVKCRRVPRILALSLNKGVGGLAAYKRKIIAISDFILHADPQYLGILKDGLNESLGLEVMSVSDVRRKVIPTVKA